MTDKKPTILVTGGTSDLGQSGILKMVADTLRDLANIVTIDDLDENQKVGFDLEDFKKNYHIPTRDRPNRPKLYPWKHKRYFKRDIPWVPTEKPLRFK